GRMSISNRGSGRTLRMIPGAVGHNYSEDHQSAPRARRSRPLISQVASGAKRSVSGGRFVKRAAACRRMNLPAEPTGLAWPASHLPVVARQSKQGGTMLQLPAHKRYAYSPIVKRPDYAWPGGKRLAFYIALNIEHFAFGTGIGMDPSNRSGQQNSRNFAWRDYGNRVGNWRLFEILDELKLPASVLLNSSVCHHYPDIVDKIKA